VEIEYACLVLTGMLCTDSKRVAVAVAVLDAAEALRVDNVREQTRRISTDTIRNMSNTITSWTSFRGIKWRSSGKHFDEIYRTVSGSLVQRREFAATRSRTCTDMASTDTLWQSNND
jgi:hypothetical protein